MRLAKIACVIVLGCISIPVQALADIVEGGVGLAYGKDHAYFLKAPPGWILDTESGAEQGIFAVFYPKGSSWNGPVVMYSTATDRKGRPLEEEIKQDVATMREKSPNLQVTEGEALQTQDNKPTLVRYFQGDTYGNYEAVAYVLEKNVVANVVLTARDKPAYESALPSFRKLVASYRFVSDEPSKLDLPALERAEKLKRVAP